MLVELLHEGEHFSSASVREPTERSSICVTNVWILEIQREDTEEINDAYLPQKNQANTAA